MGEKVSWIHLHFPDIHAVPVPVARLYCFLWGFPLHITLSIF